MKKVSLYLFALLATLTVATSCEKEEHETRDDVPETPRTTIPAEFTGKWMGGYFEMSLFQNYDGNRPENVQNMVAYNLKADGTAEQYIYYNYDDGSDKQVLTYRKGTATFDAATATIKFLPQEGTYRLFENGVKSEGPQSADGLYPNYVPQYRNCQIEEQNNTTYLLCTSSQNENIAFVKTSW
jgi:hypothetical protein